MKYLNFIPFLIRYLMRTEEFRVVAFVSLIIGAGSLVLYAPKTAIGLIFLGACILIGKWVGEMTRAAWDFYMQCLRVEERQKGAADHDPS